MVAAMGSVNHISSSEWSSSLPPTLGRLLLRF
jgi:hypothetical protein